ncbi:hypothetical protein HQ533_00350 [Candidatus Woesearchaeota archaeon]|nr:hypothetical protein [Candidatus Woesearchaeota archaeon]
MAKIHWFFYLVVGIVIAGYSKFGPMAGEPFLNVFFYIGVVFIFWGIVKMIFSPSGRRDKVMKYKEEKSKGSGNVVCPKCKSNNFTYSRYCHICAYRLH